MEAPICNMCSKTCKPCGGIIGKPVSIWKCFDCNYEVYDIYCDSFQKTNLAKLE